MVRAVRYAIEAVAGSECSQARLLTDELANLRQGLWTEQFVGAVPEIAGPVSQLRAGRFLFAAESSEGSHA